MPEPFYQKGSDKLMKNPGGNGFLASEFLPGIRNIFKKVVAKSSVRKLQSIQYGQTIKNTKKTIGANRISIAFLH